ncbi:MAG: S8 family peptidase [Candidatus Sericytochromatia bacterium]
MLVFKKTVVYTMLCLLTFTTSCRNVNTSNINPEETETNKRQVIIRRKLTASSAKSTVNILAQNRVKSIRSLGVEIVRVPDEISTQDYIKQLSNDPTIDYVEPNYIRKIALLEENYSNYPKEDLKTYINSNVNKNMRPLNSFKATFNDPDIKLQYGLEKINADGAWAVTKGDEKIVIAVVDTGVDLNHPDLAANLVKGYSTIKGTINENDDNGHGTHVAGIVSAIADNNIGVTGIAPKCKVMPIKVLSAKGDGNDSDIAEGIIWAVDHGAKVINLSLGGAGAGKTLENAILYAYNSNALVVAAMGNNGANVKNYPAAFKNVVAVGASDSKNKVAPFSNFGDWISVTAPGLKIYSTLPTYKVELSRYNLGTEYGILSGTSMAVPYVAGLAGLILSKNKNLNRAEVRKRIEQNCNDIDEKGFDDETGVGLIDASKSLAK